jgi:hypothetical protein
MSGLRKVGPADLDALVLVVYDDVDPALHEWAKLSMLAHLIKLQSEGSASVQQDVWQAVGS